MVAGAEAVQSLPEKVGTAVPTERADPTGLMKPLPPKVSAMADNKRQVRLTTAGGQSGCNCNRTPSTESQARQLAKVKSAQCAAW